MAATATLLTRDIQGESLSAATDRLVNQILFLEGVVDKAGGSFEVKQNTGTDMNVKIGSLTTFDRAVVAGDLAGQGKFITEHQNSSQVLAVAASDPTNDRIDIVILRVYDDTFDSSGDDFADIEVITGTPDASPVAPALPSTAVLLAEILVQDTVTQIVNGDITDLRVEYRLRDVLQLTPDAEVRGSDEVASVLATTADAAKATVNLTIPTTWVSWECEAWASYIRAVEDVDTPAGTFTVKIRIDGTDQQEQVSTRGFDVDAGFDTGTDINIAGAVGGRRTGMTTTGSRAIEFRASTSVSNVPMLDIYLYARAIRTS